MEREQSMPHLAADTQERPQDFIRRIFARIEERARSYSALALAQARLAKIRGER